MADGITREMKRGDTLVFDVQVFQAELFGQPDGTPTPPQNISGWFMWATFKRHYADPDNQAVCQVTSTPTSQPPDPTGGIVFIDAVNGKAEVTMPAIATVGFPDGPETLLYSVKVKDPTGRDFTVETGTVTVDPSATNAI